MLLNTFWATFGNISYAFSLWFVLALLTKNYASEDVGTYALAFAIGAPVYMLTNMRLRIVQTSDVANRFALHDYINFRLLSSITALVVIVLSAIFLFSERVVVLIVIAICTAKLIESISDIAYGFFQKHELMRYVGISQIFRSLMYVFFAGLVIVSGGTILQVALVLIIAWLIPLLLYDCRMLVRINKGKISSGGINYSIVKAIFKKSYHLSIVAFLSSLLVNIPRYMIAFYQGYDDLGIYVAMAYIAIASALIAESLGMPFLPKLANFYVNGNYRSFYWYLRLLFFVAAVLGLAGLIVAQCYGAFILELFYSPLYAQYTPTFVLIMIVAMMNHVVLYQIFTLTVIEKYRIQVYVIIFSVILLASLCAILIPLYGIKGAVYAEMCAALLQVIIFGLILTCWSKQWRDTVKINH